MPPFFKAKPNVAEVIAPESVKSPELLMVVPAASVTVPGNVSAVDVELINAPLLLIPEPLRLKLLASTKPLRSKVAPD